VGQGYLGGWFVTVSKVTYTAIIFMTTREPVLKSQLGKDKNMD
jgi:hypothetical protein